MVELGGVEDGARGGEGGRAQHLDPEQHLHHRLPEHRRRQHHLQVAAGPHPLVGSARCHTGLVKGRVAWCLFLAAPIRLKRWLAIFQFIVHFCEQTKPISEDLLRKSEARIQALNPPHFVGPQVPPELRRGEGRARAAGALGGEELGPQEGAEGPGEAAGEEGRPARPEDHGAPAAQPERLDVPVPVREVRRGQGRRGGGARGRGGPKSCWLAGWLGR